MKLFITTIVIVSVLCLIISDINGQYLGDRCRIRQGRRTQRGSCAFLRDCPYAIEQVRANFRPKLCGFEGIDAIVCCPRTSSNIDQPPLNLPGTKSRAKCEEYANTQLGNKNNLQFTTTVVGGTPSSSAKEFPHMAALGFGNENDIQWLCGGTLISEKFVLTAAHCLSSREYGQVKFVRVGDLNLKSITDDAQPQTLLAAAVYRHPDYRSPSQYNDIALIELDRPVVFTNYVKPACLQTEFDLPQTAGPIATGWGRLGFTGETSDQLMKVTLGYFNNQQCRSVYASVPERSLPNGIDDNTQICAGGINESKDTCQGDSGGPLQIKNPSNSKQYYVIGVTSFGKGCGIQNIPGVYTRVSNYVPWIESLVWPTD
ncbi:hypothetical protein ILUMI_09110 [Ignelater luminosus]|uniref:Uncharacterized protein n=1 Tax=Ignelater luminosus TaxID=2038154 RepID=A0A8K0D0F2_IGNLU|nr:hypothetical protein ILUMI_09110 [Ignelater luminosus]